jgi:glyoxylase-like metal-dependent hydrolase (beta-lactamase superfamily II)
MNSVKVLIEGYAKEIKDGWIASSTVTLVQSNNLNIIVDPGCNRQRLIDALAKEGLKPADIDFVLLTHSHTDHTLLSGMFENAKVLNEEEVYNGDKQTDHGGKIPGTDLKIIDTRGHSENDVSLIVPTEKGTYAIVADLFWWKDDEKEVLDINHPDPYVTDMTQIVKSRKKILEIADFIIPGHGKVLKVSK